MRRLLARLLFTGLLALGVTANAGQAPGLIGFQGTIRDSLGALVNGTYNVTFTIYKSSGGVDSVWKETQNSLVITSGALSATLGSATSIADSVFNNDTRYLGIKLNSWSELTPRIRVLSVGYALRVNTIDGATGGTITSAITAGKGNFGTSNINTGTDAFAAGNSDTASGNYSTVAGGKGNSATGLYTTIGGGVSNQALYERATIAGGELNLINGTSTNGAAVGGGKSNTITNGAHSVIAGGFNNEILGSPYGAISGGQQNHVDTAAWAWVGGGLRCYARGQFAVIGGGGGALMSGTSHADGEYSTIGGGYLQAALGDYTFVGGGANDTASVDYAAVAGGNNNRSKAYAAFTGGGEGNLASGQYSVISGGEDNIANTDFATIAGGQDNIASGINSFIGSGLNDSASGKYSMVPGGEQNKASGNYSFAGGRRAKAINLGAFVWADSSANSDFSSTANNQFRVRAAGGTQIYSNSGLTAGVTLAAGGGSWASVSDSTKKRNAREVIGSEILDKLDQLPIKQWSYKAQDPSIEHIGPMAQDFFTVFKLGDDDTTISTIDPAGIALAAAKELHQLYKKLSETTDALAAKTTELETVKSQLAELQKTVQQLVQANSTAASQYGMVDKSSTKR